eukprot:13669790-Alexandrium_andersonii.AAC.1
MGVLAQSPRRSGTSSSNSCAAPPAGKGISRAWASGVGWPPRTPSADAAGHCGSWSSPCHRPSAGAPAWATPGNRT